MARMVGGGNKAEVRRVPGVGVGPLTPEPTGGIAGMVPFKWWWVPMMGANARCWPNNRCVSHLNGGCGVRSGYHASTVVMGLGSKSDHIPLGRSGWGAFGDAIQWPAWLGRGIKRK